MIAIKGVTSENQDNCSLFPGDLTVPIIFGSHCHGDVYFSRMRGALFLKDPNIRLRRFDDPRQYKQSIDEKIRVFCNNLSLKWRNRYHELFIRIFNSWCQNRHQRPQKPLITKLLNVPTKFRLLPTFARLSGHSAIEGKCNGENYVSTPCSTGRNDGAPRVAKIPSPFNPFRHPLNSVRLLSWRN